MLYYKRVLTRYADTVWVGEEQESRTQARTACLVA